MIQREAWEWGRFRKDFENYNFEAVGQAWCWNGFDSALRTKVSYISRAKWNMHEGIKSQIRCQRASTLFN
ncbi:hypothetical protein Fmac_019584 [Flemingia macrophylla]|uniref:Uncharacterized protein n=1 Tax=Flemingia macrophylla TaxID=520843 RepID=A0ABD1M877_9FABA